MEYLDISSEIFAPFSRSCRNWSISLSRNLVLRLACMNQMLLGLNGLKLIYQGGSHGFMPINQNPVGPSGFLSIMRQLWYSETSRESINTRYSPTGVCPFSRQIPRHGGRLRFVQGYWIFVGTIWDIHGRVGMYKMERRNISYKSLEAGLRYEWCSVTPI